MFFGFTFEKLILVALIAALLIGPTRLPRAAQLLADTVKTLKRFVAASRTRLREELGPEFDEVDWRKLDPRQYDPRRIVRSALLDDAYVPPRATSHPTPKAASAGVDGVVASAGGDEQR